MRVLVVEDDRVNQRVALELLSRLGISAAVADDGVDALERLEQEPFDVLFLDINMPSVSGLEFRRMLPPDQMVIFTTAHPEHAAEGFELPGADLSNEELSVRVLPRQADEFTCSVCFLVHHRSQLATDKGGELICKECAA